MTKDGITTKDDSELTSLKAFCENKGIPFSADNVGTIVEEAYKAIHDDPGRTTAQNLVPGVIRLVTDGNAEENAIVSKGRWGALVSDNPYDSKVTTYKVTTYDVGALSASVQEIKGIIEENSLVTSTSSHALNRS